MLKIPAVKTVNEFVDGITALRTQQGLSIMDAIIAYCDLHDVEYESVAPLIKNLPKLKADLQNEAESLNYLPKSAKLPI